MNEIIQAVLDERQRQNEKWGANRDLPFNIWLLILQEEIGEFAKGILEEEPLEHLVTEAVQITAVAVQISEWMSTKAGWPCTSKEVLDLVQSRCVVENGLSITTYWHMVRVMGDLAIGRANGTFDEEFISARLRRLVAYGLHLIKELRVMQGFPRLQLMDVLNG